MFGRRSTPVAALSLQQAYLHFNENCLTDAREAFDHCLSCLPADAELSMDLSLALLYLYGRIHESEGLPWAAFRLYWMALGDLNRMTGTEYSLHPRQVDLPWAVQLQSGGQLEEGARQRSKTASHPLALFLLNRISSILLEQQNFLQATVFAQEFLYLWRDFFFAGTVEQRVQFFGAVVPRPLILCQELASLPRKLFAQPHNPVPEDPADIFARLPPELSPKDASKMSACYEASAIWKHLPQMALSPYSSRSFHRSLASIQQVAGQNTPYQFNELPVDSRVRPSVGAAGRQDVEYIKTDVCLQLPQGLAEEWPELGLQRKQRVLVDNQRDYHPYLLIPMHARIKDIVAGAGAGAGTGGASANGNEDLVRCHSYGSVVVTRSKSYALTSVLWAMRPVFLGFNICR